MKLDLDDCWFERNGILLSSLKAISEFPVELDLYSRWWDWFNSLHFGAFIVASSFPMVESTRLKDLATKMKTILAVMDQREESLLATMVQGDKRVKLLEQSMTSLSKYLETHQVLRFTPIDSFS